MTPPARADDALPAGPGAVVAAIAEGRGRGTSPCALLVIGLDGVALLRGIAGHAAASKAHAELSGRLAGMPGGSGVVVLPFEHDKIAVVCPGLDEPQARDLAELAVQVIGAPLAGQRLARVGANAGLAVATGDDMADEGLLRDAEAALVVAAARGPGAVESFRPSHRESLVTRMTTAAELAEALGARRGLFLEYQPVVDLVTGEVTGVEALVRWRHPQRGLVSPVDFIPVAERAGLIGQLGRWVLETAVAQLGEWQPLVRDGFRLHVNLSPLEILQAGLVDRVSDVLDRHGVPSARLLLEITETGLVTSEGEAVSRLEELHAVGVGLGIDDFGTGYSSISYLRELPVDMVKIDRSLTSLVASSPEEYALTRAIFALVRSSGMEIVAEGIEEHVQMAHLRAMRCRLGQGYLLARPAGPEVVGDLLGMRNSAV